MKKLSQAVTIAGALVVLASATQAQEYAPDNSGKNLRDRAPEAVTAGDQSNDKSDLTITQQIRQAIMADKDLSITAQNVKVVTADGIVTLRGPVNSAAEKASIAEKAKRVAGVTRVDNQLEVASK